MSLDSAWSPPDWAHDPYGVPEYCNACATSLYVKVPRNYYFYHYPRSGNGMMQVQMFAGVTTPNARDYLQGHLSQTLVAGHKYNVRFYTSLTQGGNYAINNIGAYLDDGSIDTTHNPGYVQNQYTPQIVDTNVINDTLNWIKIEDTFTATGTEKLITIGQFADSAHTNYISVTGTAGCPCTWYLVDDVSVIDCSNVPFAGNDTIISVGDSVFLGTHEPLLPYKWYKLGSSTPIDSSGGIWVHPTVNTTYILEQKLCGVTKYDTMKVWLPDGVSNVQSAVSQLKLYPNPATKEITIEGAKNCTVLVSDVTGRLVASFVSMTNKEVIDISALDKGIYFVEVVDQVTHFKITRRLSKE